MEGRDDSTKVEARGLEQELGSAQKRATTEKGPIF